MIPDIELDACIEMVTDWSKLAGKKKELTGNSEYIILAHKFDEIVRHLNNYKKLKESLNEFNITIMV